MDERQELQSLLDELAEVKREYTRLVFDEEDWMIIGEPATPSQIDKLEAKLGSQVPPSYRAFLELHNGWTHFDGGLHLLSVEDQKSDWVRDWLKMLEMVFLAVNEENPFKKGALPVMLGEGEHDFLLLDPDTLRPDGEMDFVKYHFAEVDDCYKDFTSFLRANLDVELQLLEKEKKGIPDEEQDED